MNKTKIIATIGPASSDKDILREMYYSGMSVARLNLSHANHDFCSDIVKKINSLNKELDSHIAIMMDLQGPDIRVGKFVGGSAKFIKGDKIRIYMDDTLGDNTKFSVSYKNLLIDVKEDAMLKVNDGKVELKVLEKKPDCLLCQVVTDGIISDHKSLNAPGTKFNRAYLSDKDKDDIRFASDTGCDFLSLSFVSSHEDILDVNDMLIELGNDHIAIVSKIENQNALDDIDEIINASDVIMVARGDLGTELPMERIPGIQKSIINKCHNFGKTSIVATEMLASMEQVIRPTRAEVSDVANAVLDGTDAIMLSGETTVGKYPVETVDMMSRIANAAEGDIDYIEMLERAMRTENQDITGSISYSVAASAARLHAKAIVAPTRSGYTALKMSRFRPSCPIIALSPSEDTLRSLALSFGVYGVKVPEMKTFDDIMVAATNAARKMLQVEKGDVIIITGGYPPKDKKATNFMKIEEL
jgi:pyruvate kinase